ncbi:hypothetical protein H6P1_00129 (plasmid) [Variovorax sp. PBL-H6]|nr:hypothetical protein H6P1_00129 [Variovorax sp. PBL-H6]VTU44171.1 hypothetical protein SRS16P1_00773 [Variovorax sp. SRS16]VTU44252.1 hypothetical protein E5P1_00766 [Variovorax sp. PBL-E5]
MQPKSAHVKRVMKARSDMLADQPFFGFLALRLKLAEDPTCAGMWTDSVTLGFNPRYIDTLVDVELKGLISATVLHIVAGHPWRQDSRETVLWNEACDEAIHPMVLKSGFRLPQGMATGKEHLGFSAEFIYSKLLEARPPAPPPAPPTPEGGGGDADGGDGGSDPTPSPEGQEGPEPRSPDNGSGSGEPETGEQDGEGGQPQAAPVTPQMLGEVRQAPKEAENGQGTKSLETEWQLAVEAATHMQGDLPGNVMSLVGEALKSRVDWKSVLQNFVETSMHAPDYTMAVVNRRYLHLGFILPGLRGASMKTLVVARDTSGSVKNDYRRLFNGEILDIVERLKPERVVVLDIDTHIRKVQDMVDDVAEELDQTTYGGGGTHFEPAFSYVEDEDIECCCMVYLTDLLGTFPCEAPDYPVLWAVPEGSNRGKLPPFGEMVELDVD